MPESSIANVSDTAFWIAHYRAVETDRPNALFRDPLARVLAGDRGKEIAEAMPMPFFTRWVVVIRTHIIDDYIRVALKQGVDTVLNLGAGLDTRPYRMDLPSPLLWVEADYPHVIEYKEERLLNQSPRCQLERRKLNLGDVAARREVLESVKVRTTKLLIITEGVIPYLSVEEVGSLADDFRALDQGCYWIVDYHSPKVVEFRRRFGIERKMQNAPWRFMPKDWFAFFREHGWYAREIRYLAEEAQHLGRPVQVPLRYKIFLKTLALFSSNERREEFRKVSGYAMLEPEKGSGQGENRVRAAAGDFRPADSPAVRRERSKLHP